MRSGGSNAKGNGYENEICKMFSRWISRGQRSDLFRRNVTSGGRHTSALRRGSDAGQPGDIAADHPDAFPLLAAYFVECKFHVYLDVNVALWRSKGTLFGFLVKCEEQSQAVGRQYMLIAKQNRQPALCFVPYSSLDRVHAAGLAHHELWNRRSVAFLLDHLLLKDPDLWVP